MREINAYILAGGKSSRMGANKALLPFGDRETLAQFQCDRLKKYSLFSKIAFSLKSLNLPFEAEAILDDSEISAPIVAIATILRKTQSDLNFVISVDAPFFDKEAIERLINAIDNLESIAAIAKTPSGIHPLCAIYSKRFLPKLESAIAVNNLSLKSAFEGEKIVYVDYDEKPLTNLNYFGEYQAANGAK